MRTQAEALALTDIGYLDPLPNWARVRQAANLERYDTPYHCFIAAGEWSPLPEREESE